MRRISHINTWQPTSPSDWMAQVRPPTYANKGRPLLSQFDIHNTRMVRPQDQTPHTSPQRMHVYLEGHKKSCNKSQNSSQEPDFTTTIPRSTVRAVGDQSARHSKTHNTMPPLGSLRPQRTPTLYSLQSPIHQCIIYPTTFGASAFDPKVSTKIQIRYFWGGGRQEGKMPTECDARRHDEAVLVPPGTSNCATIHRKDRGPRQRSTGSRNTNDERTNTMRFEGAPSDAPALSAATPKSAQPRGDTCVRTTRRTDR